MRLCVRACMFESSGSTQYEHEYAYHTPIIPHTVQIISILERAIQFTNMQHACLFTSKQSKSERERKRNRECGLWERESKCERETQKEKARAPARTRRRDISHTCKLHCAVSPFRTLDTLR